MPARNPIAPLGLIAAALFACLAVGCAAPPSALDNAVRGVSLEDAQQQADADNRVLLVFGTADWCGWCVRMKEETWIDSEVRDWIAHNATILYLDTDEHPDVRDALEMQGIPHTIAFRNGEEIDRLVGFREPEDFLEWLSGLG